MSDPTAGFSMAFDKYGTVAGTPYIPTDQRLEGPQGLTFRTPPMTAATPIAGPIALHLEAASTAADTDWYAKLADVAPDGGETIVTAGALKASHRALDPVKSTPERPYHTHVNPTPIEPGRFYAYDIEIWPTAYELAPGHRLQLRVTSSDLPTHLPGTFVFDRDHPEAARVQLNAPATNTVRLGASYLSLPVTGAPRPARPPRPATRSCRRSVALHVRGVPRRARILTVRVTVDGRRVAFKRHGRRVDLVLRGRRGARVRVRIQARYRAAGRTRTALDRRAFRVCAAGS